MEHLPTPGQPPGFDDFANQLLMEGSAQSPAYLHGGICGVYASAGPIPAEECLAASSQALELALKGELSESALLLAAHSRAALLDEEFGFQLFLPDDETEIYQRVQALAEWCRGFLAGYALLLQQDSPGGLDSDSSESLRDMAAIAEAAVDAEADEEESETHFYEISEYLRFAALNLFMNRLGDDDPPPADHAGMDDDY